ncbi:MAG: co-chaperone GroES [Armatimonadota bacterium]|nr:MAG: co-chaperone GroES [Armatimonadota bacterium]
MLRPLADRILVKPGEEEEVTQGGIVLPDTAKKRPREGEVLAVGPGKLLDNGQRAPMEVSVGDIVVYSEYGGTEITVGTEEYVILDEGSVLAINPAGKKSKSKK